MNKNNKKYLIFVCFFLLIIPFTFSDFGSIFGPKSPPGQAPGYICSPAGCIVNGDINFNGFTQYNMYIKNSTLENVTIKNVTFMDEFHVNSTFVTNPYWVNRSGDTMTGDLYMSFNDILNINYITALNWSNVNISASQVYNFNQTVEDIVGIKEEIINVNVNTGVGFGQTSICCFPTAQILEVSALPISSSNTYRFSANGTVSGDAVDTDRLEHTGDWIVSHSGSTVIVGENISFYIIDASIDENFNVKVRWRT